MMPIQQKDFMNNVKHPKDWEIKGERVGTGIEQNLATLKSVT